MMNAQKWREGKKLVFCDSKALGEEVAFFVERNRARAKARASRLTKFDA